ncbi:MAG: outer membrane protein assembly factor BamD [Bradymonadia bacterium]
MRLTRTLLIVTMLPMVGCVSHWRGEKIETDLAALQGQVEALTETSRDGRKSLNDELASAVKRIEGLESKLTAAIEGLRTGSANRGVEVDQLREQLQQLNGQLAEIQQKMANNTSALPAIPSNGGQQGGNPLPDGEADLYRYGYERKRDNDCDEAIRAFSKYAQSYPQAAQADNAIYLMAECLSQRADYTSSLKALRTIMEKYPKGDKVDDALILTHDNFVALDRCKDGIPFLERLLAEMPNSNRVREGSKKLKNTKRTCR